MQERIQYIRTVSTVIRNEISGGIDLRLRSMNLFESERARQIVDKSIRGINIEPIPSSLEERKRAILVSNYPISVEETTKAVLKVGCRLPGEKARFKAIGREEVVKNAGLILKMLGVDNIVYQAHKDETGIYKLKSRKSYEEIKDYLAKPGSVIWLSITGETRGNGLLEEDLRTGAVVFSLKSQAPIIPMGIVAKEGKAIKVRFGRFISPTEIEGLSDIEKGDFLIDFSKLVMCQIARLLPSGQRGDFENVEEKLTEINKRLEAYRPA